MGNRAVLALGSNIAPRKNMALAVKLLKSKFKLLAESRSIRTKPIGFRSQPDFINKMLCIETMLTLRQLKTSLKNIEKELGRKPSTFRFGPRVIDIDITIWNETIVDKDFYDRKFLRQLTQEILGRLR